MTYTHIKRFRLDTTNRILTQIVRINDAIFLVQSDLDCHIPARASLRLANANQAKYEVEKLEKMIYDVSDELVTRIIELKKEVKR